MVVKITTAAVTTKAITAEPIGGAGPSSRTRAWPHRRRKRARPPASRVFVSAGLSNAERPNQHDGEDHERGERSEDGNDDTPANLTNRTDVDGETQRGHREDG